MTQAGPEPGEEAVRDAPGDALWREIREIPERARAGLEAHRGLRLPTGLPYLGMGSSWYAALAVRGAGAEIRPEPAAEFYFAERRSGPPTGQAVLISQSGRSAETLACRDGLEGYQALTNDPASDLATAPRCRRVVELHAGPETGSATKTYVNTLVALYAGLGFEGLEGAVAGLAARMTEAEATGRELARRIHRHLAGGGNRGLFILGGGPNWGTALQGALILSECSKHAFTGLSLAQYDHGPKETAAGSFVVAIEAGDEASARTGDLLRKIAAHGATTARIRATDLPGPLSPLAAILPLNFAAFHLARALGVTRTFTVGAKIT